MIHEHKCIYDIEWFGPEWEQAASCQCAHINYTLRKYVYMCMRKAYVVAYNYIYKIYHTVQNTTIYCCSMYQAQVNESQAF